jgi:hypothetical protein
MILFPITAILTFLICWLTDCYRNQLKPRIAGLPNPFGRKKRIAEAVTRKLLNEDYYIDTLLSAQRIAEIAKECGVTVDRLNHILVSHNHKK